MTLYRSGPNRHVPWGNPGLLLLALVRLAERRYTPERKAPLFEDIPYRRGTTPESPKGGAPATAIPR